MSGIVQYKPLSFELILEITQVQVQNKDALGSWTEGGWQIFKRIFKLMALGEFNEWFY